MIQPSPTSRLEPGLARGTLVESCDATVTKPAVVKISYPNSSYELHLVPTGEISTAPGKRIIGSIRVDARRLDRPQAGGLFVEPVCGRPRRVQGRVISADPSTNSVVVNAGIPIHLHITAPGQSASDFAPGDIVSCDVHEGATFAPAPSH